MPLDTTLAGASADAYISVGAADAFARSDLGRNAKAWLDSTADVKEAALRRATREIDTFVGFVGDPFDDAQVLVFPRSIDVIDDAVFLPESIGWATYEQAAFLIRNADALDDWAQRRAQGLTNFSNPDGTGGTIATDEAWAFSPRARARLEALTQRSVIAQIVTT